MPYYITDEASGCSGWATVKEDGEVMGCHDTKQGAIDQALAIAQNEGSTYEGERSIRAAADELSVGDFVEWNSSGGMARGRIVQIARSGTLNVPDTSFTLNATEDNPAALIRIYEREGDGWDDTDTLVGHRFSTLTKIDPLPEPSGDDSDERQVDLSVPSYIRAAAAQGVEYHEEGLSGDGVVPRTVSEARAMARGEVSEDKVVRASAWAARHRPDLDAQGARPDEEGYPTPGAVAHLLWGIPTGGRYDDAVAWFDRKAEQVKADRSVMMVTPVKPRAKGSQAEFRSFEGEIRAEGDGSTFVGYAAKFNVPSEPLPFTERIAPGAFGKSLRQRSKDVRLYINHNSDMVLASKKSGTLRLMEDSVGLRVEADLPDTTAARDLRALMQAGVVSTMSFGFTVPRGGDKWSGDGMERTLTGINLHEVSVVTGFPAYPQTTAAVRSLEKLSERTGIAVEELTEALDALAEGETLEPSQADLLLKALQDAMPKPEVNSAQMVALKKKQMDLLAKKW